MCMYLGCKNKYHRHAIKQFPFISLQYRLECYTFKYFLRFKMKYKYR